MEAFRGELVLQDHDTGSVGVLLDYILVERETRSRPNHTRRTNREAIG